MSRPFAWVAVLALGSVFSCQSTSPPPARAVHGLHLNQIYDAEDWFLAMRAYPSGIPAGGRVGALTSAAALDARTRAHAQLRPNILPDPGSWFPIGPTPATGIPTYGVPTTFVDAAGRATVIASNPANANEVWLGTATGGVWHTLNAQSTDPEWVPIDGLQFADEIPTANGGTVTPGAMAMSIGAIAVDGCRATGCQNVWIGTGEDGIRRDTYYGAGLFLQTPEPIPQIRVAPQAAGDPLVQVADFRSGSIVAIALAPHNTATTTPILYVAVSSGVTAPGNEETVTAPAPSGGYGVYMTTNTNTFTKLPIPGIERSLPTDTQFDPNDPTFSTLLVGVMAQNVTDPTAARGILRGTHGGTDPSDWCSINDNTAAGIPTCSPGTSGLPPGNSVVAVPPQFSSAYTPNEVLGYITLAFSTIANRVYALVGQCGQRVDFGCIPVVYRSDDDGASWVQVPLTFPKGQVDGCNAAGNSYGRYTHALAVVPGGSAASEQILIGGTLSMSCAGVSGACQLVGGGSDCTQTHPDKHSFAFPVSGSASVIYQANDGGFFFSQDSGQHWTAGNTTLTTSQIDGLAVIDQTLVTGLQDNGIDVFTGARTWQNVTGSDGGQVVAYSFGSPLQAVWLSTIQRGGGLLRWIGTPSSGSAQSLFSNLPASAILEFNNDGPGAAECAYFPPLAVNRNTHDFYIASVEVYKSTDTGDVRGDTWTSISPVLPLQTGANFSTIDTDNVITAMDVANDGTVYVGSYIGEVWVCPGPCSSAPSWNKIAGPQVLGGSYGALPALPISSIAVQPSNSSTAYIAYSGFLQDGTGNHVWATTSSGAGWSTASNGLVDAPANVLRYDSQGKLWLGTDIGIYSFDGVTWTRDATLPEVPVTAIASWPTSLGQRLYAGTHGRGAWILAEPNVMTLEGWSMGSIWDVPVYGTGFAGPADSCTVSLLQTSGNVCASGTVDVSSSHYGPGLPIKVDGSGQLETGMTPPSTWDNKPVVWACREGTCLNGIPIKNCNVDPSGAPDLLSTVIVDCGAAGKGTATILNAPTLGNPPSPQQASLLFDPPARPPPGVPPPPPSWTFEAVVSLTEPSAARLLCVAPVTVPQSATDDQIVTATAAAINASADCQNAEVFGVANTTQEQAGEDPGSFQPSVTVDAPTQTAWELFVTFRSAPGAATGLCFIMDGLGDAVLHQSAIMQTVFRTPPGGATGGALRIVESTNLGTCQQDVRTTAGMTADQVVGAVVQAFGSVTAPGPAGCLARANALDLQPSGSTLFSVIARKLQICSFDNGIGIATTPDTVDVPNEPPDCTTVQPTPPQLWPPNNKMVPVSLSTALDPDGNAVTMQITQVSQDENPDAETDAQLIGGQLLLRAQRDGNGDGRVYHIDFSATDSQGLSCTGEVTVCVPHDQGKDSCVDEGPLYPSGVP